MHNFSELLDCSPWATELTPNQRQRVSQETIVRDIEAGGHVCRRGEPVDFWFGVIDGLLKMTNISSDGKPTTFTGVPSGGWFGEGSILKSEKRRYDIITLRDSRIACMPRSTFHWLLGNSIPFNRFLIMQLNERLGQFIAMVERDRLLCPDARVARGLAAMYNPILYPGIGPLLPVSQEEIGYLAGLSRQRANQALQNLEREGLLSVEYGCIRIHDIDGLRSYGA